PPCQPSLGAPRARWISGVRREHRRNARDLQLLGSPGHQLVELLAPALDATLERVDLGAESIGLELAQRPACLEQEAGLDLVELLALAQQHRLADRRVELIEGARDDRGQLLDQRGVVAVDQAQALGMELAGQL